MASANPGASAPIFLNYRVEDSKDVSARLHDELEYAFGVGQVFLDLSSISAGTEWPDLIRDRVTQSSVVLVVIGRDWLKVQVPRSYQRRLDSPDDWVGLEIELAIGLKKTIIPVLVRDAEPPTADVLPPPLKALAGRQAVRISSEAWKADVGRLVGAIAAHGIRPTHDPADRPARNEPSMIGIIEYFYRRIGDVAYGELEQRSSAQHIVNCPRMRDLWQLIDYLMRQDQPIEKAPFIRVDGQLSPYAPLLFGNPTHKRRLHLDLRQGAVQLIEELGYEFGELLNGLLSYSAGQMVIRAYFRAQYVYLGLYESIVRNSIPVLVERTYFERKLLSMFHDSSTLQVSVHGFLGEIPNYAKDALNDFGIMSRLRSVVAKDTLQELGQPNYALFVNGDDNSYITVAELAKEHPSAPRYLDGDVWIANSANSLITRFIDISHREDMIGAVREMERELPDNRFGRGTVSSFDVEIAPITDTQPDRVLSGEQLARQRDLQKGPSNRPSKPAGPPKKRRKGNG